MRKAEWKREQRRKAREQKAEAAVAEFAKRLGVSPRAYIAEIRGRQIGRSLARSLDQFGKVL
jgi:hypothetical protein